MYGDHCRVLEFVPTPQCFSVLVKPLCENNWLLFELIMGRTQCEHKERKLKPQRNTDESSKESCMKNTWHLRAPKHKESCTLMSYEHWLISREAAFMRRKYGHGRHHRKLSWRRAIGWCSAWILEEGLEMRRHKMPGMSRLSHVVRFGRSNEIYAWSEALALARAAGGLFRAPNFTFVSWIVSFSTKAYTSLLQGLLSSNFFILYTDEYWSIMSLVSMAMGYR